MSIQKNNVAEKDVDSMKRLRNNQEENNPCYKRIKKKISAQNLPTKTISMLTNEHLLSLKCLDFNQEKRNVCEVYFVNYRNCKDFWTTVQSERRLKGIKPYLPPLEERAKIKADFFNSR